MKYFKMPMESLNKAFDDIKTVPNLTAEELKEFSGHIAAAKKVIIDRAAKNGVTINNLGEAAKEKAPVEKKKVSLGGL